ncbi:hypothetical protein CRUP_016619 [Coryphaenoides rupestris]|nr:hypothetical protein CRUP_016619 [Coryphaenoides rupestris]
MEGVLNNVRGTAELLAVAGTDVVQRWDEHTLQRAFQWTLYCQHLHSRFHNKKTIRNTMEQHLRATHGRLTATFPGYTAGIGRFEDLSRWSAPAAQQVTEESRVARAIVETLVANPNPVGSDQEEHQVDAATGHCTQLIACKSACKVLLRALRQMRPVACPGADAEVQGVMLMERLDAVLGGGGDGDGGGGGDAQVAHELLKVDAPKHVWKTTMPFLSCFGFDKEMQHYS